MISSWDRPLAALRNPLMGPKSVGIGTSIELVRRPSSFHARRLPTTLDYFVENYNLVMAAPGLALHGCLGVGDRIF
jgi:hypothetical protein